MTMRLILTGKAKDVFSIIRHLVHPDPVGALRVCAWCGLTLGRSKTGIGTTHGICDGCAEREFGRLVREQRE